MMLDKYGMKIQVREGICGDDEKSRENTLTLC